MATAGRTVAVSGVTVAISLAGLLIFPQVFLRSMGFGGMSAVLVAMVAALTAAAGAARHARPEGRRAVGAAVAAPGVPPAGRAAAGRRPRRSGTGSRTA